MRLTQIYLDRIHRLDPTLLSFATVRDAVALAQAKRADALLACGTARAAARHSLGRKDILDTAGIITGWGAEPFAERVPEKDAEVVRRLAAAGAVLLGKTSVGALAYGDVWYGGRTRNPWNLAEGSSGSSAGSASATAAGLVGFAIGTETLGSIVAPSPAAAPLACGPPSGGSPARARWRCAGRSTRSARSAAPSRTPHWCWRRSTARCPDDPSRSRPLQLGRDPVRPRAGASATSRPTSEARPRALDAARPWLGLVPLHPPDLPYDTLMSTAVRGGGGLVRGADPGEPRRRVDLAGARRVAEHLPQGALPRRSTTSSSTAFAAWSCRSWTKSSALDVIIGPALAGPMPVITNFTGHPSLILRTGFSEIRTREMPAFLDAAIRQTRWPCAQCPLRRDHRGAVVRRGGGADARACAGGGAWGPADRRPVLP